jgi:hypothetical protein
MSQEKVMYPQAERQRKLQSITFAENQILQRDLPRDTILKGLMLRLSGSVITTYGSGTPVANAQSTFDSLIPRIDIIVGGSRVVKSVRPHLLHIQQLFATQIQGERCASAAASAATDNYATSDGGFVYGTTGQVSTVRESVLLPFEMMYAESGLGRESTWLNLKGVASAEIRLTCAAFASLQGFGNTAPVVYSGSTFVIDIITTEAQDVPANIVFSDWKQTVKEVSVSAESRDLTIDINRGNSLSGIMLFVRDGQAGSAATASGKLASNLGVLRIALKLNGQTDIKNTDFKALQAENRARYGVSAPFASGVSRLDGVAHLNLLSRKDLSTALEVRMPAVDNCQLVIDTNNATNVSYTNPLTISVMTEEIVAPR